MTAWKIPKMTEPLGRYWDQPKGLRDRVQLHPTYAVILKRDWEALPVYDISMPSGVYAGKVWRCKDCLCWYGPGKHRGQHSSTIHIVGVLPAVLHEAV